MTIAAFYIATITLSGVYAQQLNTIATNPILPENKIATNYAGLMFSTKFEQQSNQYSTCGWVGQSIGGEILFLNIVGIYNVTTQSAEVICFQSATIITTTLLIKSPLTRKSDVFSVACISTNAAGPITIVEQSISITDCSTVPPLVVDSASATYNSVGTFSCANNGTLYYSNGTRPTSPQTICLAIAKWSGQDGLKCWKASSNVNIKGNLTALEGNEINLACSYTPGIPNVTNVFFGVNDQEFSGQTYRKILNRNDNKKRVYCQVNNGYTDIEPKDPNDGRSPIYQLNVLYAPFANTSNECYISFTTLQGNLECDVVFYSNPNATFVSVIDVNSGRNLNSSKNAIIVQEFSGKHTFKFTDYKVSNDSRSIEYNLTVHVPGVPPLYHTIPFIVNINNPLITTTTPAAIASGQVTIIAIIVMIVLLTVFATAFVVVTVLYWRLRHKYMSMLSISASSKQEDKGNKMEFERKWITPQATTNAKDSDGYLSIVDNQSKTVYHEIDGCKNLNDSTLVQQLEKQNLTASTTPYINLHLEQKSSATFSYQNVNSGNTNNAEKKQSTKPESDYEIMNVQIAKTE